MGSISGKREMIRTLFMNGWVGGLVERYNRQAEIFGLEKIVQLVRN